MIGVGMTSLIQKVRKSVMSFFSKFVDFVSPNSSQTGKSTMDQCSPADIAADPTIVSQETPMTEHLDKYYAYEYGDFAIRKTRFGVFTSYDRELVDLVTAGTYEVCMQATLSHLRWAREGYVAPEGKESTADYSATVGGKL